MWTFDTSLDPSRRAALSAPPTFDSLVAQVAQEMEILCCHHQACDDDTHFSRIVYCIRVGEPLFDLFFNSQSGYRAAYYHSPYRGLEANAQFIQSVMPRLLAWSQPTSAQSGIDFARESLTTPSAKAWLAEGGIHFDNCHKCRGEWKTPSDEKPEILNGRWELADCPIPKWGRKAPYLKKIRLFGAFLNARMDEFVPTRKRHRARDIHDCGWS